MDTQLVETRISFSRRGLDLTASRGLAYAGRSGYLGIGIWKGRCAASPCWHTRVDFRESSTKTTSRSRHSAVGWPRRLDHLGCSQPANQAMADAVPHVCPKEKLCPRYCPCLPSHRDTVTQHQIISCLGSYCRHCTRSEQLPRRLF